MIRVLPCLVGLVLVAWANAVDARSFSWAEVRTIAERNAPELQVSSARHAVSGSEVQIAGTLANPSVNVSTARETAKLGVALSQPLPLFGQRGAQIHAAEADATTAAWDLEVARIEALHDVSLAWVDLWEAERRATLLEAAATDANRLRDIADERFGAGSSPRLDSVRATGDSARARAEAQAAVLIVDAAGSRVGYFLGTITEASRTSGDPAIAGSLPSLDVLTNTDSGALHPLLARDGAAIRAAEAHLSAERRARWPVVSGEIAVNWRDPTLGATDVIGGLGLEMPVLNLRGGLIARAQAQKALAEATRDLDIARLGTELRSAHARFAAASLRSRGLHDDVLPTLEEARRMTEESYREGRADFVRVLEAQRALTETRLALVESSAAAARAWADLERALGHRLGLSASPPEAHAR